jgi:hypothetical protein
MAEARKTLFITPPDNPMAIFVDHIAYIVKDGEGCKVRTSDGTDHVFHSISYERMLTMIGSNG